VIGAPAPAAACDTGEAACVTLPRSAAEAWPARTIKTARHIRVEPAIEVTIRAPAPMRVEGC